MNFHLIQHFKSVHEGKKPFKCTICDTCFSLKTNLSKHIKSVHEKRKPFKCNICDADFASKQGMNNHTETVHDEQYSNAIYVSLALLKNAA